MRKIKWTRTRKIKTATTPLVRTPKTIRIRIRTRTTRTRTKMVKIPKIPKTTRTRKKIKSQTLLHILARLPPLLLAVPEVCRGVQVVLGTKKSVVEVQVVVVGRVIITR